MPATKTTIGDNGVVTDLDTAQAGSSGFSPYKLPNIKAKTSSVTLTPAEAGVITVSGSSALTLVMPKADECPGAIFAIRTLSNHAHALTGSQETEGTRVFALLASGSSETKGSKLTFPVGGLAGATTGGGPSVALMSDGKNFLVLGASGAVAISGT